MTDEYSQTIKISSSDGKNVVESVINDIRKQVDKGKVEFGLDIEVERVEEQNQSAEFQKANE